MRERRDWHRSIARDLKDNTTVRREDGLWETTEDTGRTHGQAENEDRHKTFIV